MSDCVPGKEPPPVAGRTQRPACGKWPRPWIPTPLARDHRSAGLPLSKQLRQWGGKYRAHGVSRALRRGGTFASPAFGIGMRMSRLGTARMLARRPTGAVTCPSDAEPPRYLALAEAARRDPRLIHNYLHAGVAG